MNIKRIKVAIIGAAGYTGEELIRILLHHPFTEITCITSRENAGKSIGSVFPRYADLELIFSEPDVKKITACAEVAFLCLPHGLAAEYAVPLVNNGIKVFDISADFRLKSLQKYKEYYKIDHPSPNGLSQAVYGLPEKNRECIKKANLIACPGCYPTSVILPLFPLIKENLILLEGIKISGMSGVTGAGRKMEIPYLFSECNESIRSYSTVKHRHTPEIEQELEDAAGTTPVIISFWAHLIPINRGLYSTIYAHVQNSRINLSDVEKTFNKFYDNEPFIRVLPLGKLADTKNVIYTNVCEIGFNMDTRTGGIILTSAIDNLTKGASGQAVQCMNIVCGLEQTEGLKWVNQ